MIKQTKTPITINHKSPMFFNGIIAMTTDFTLETFQTGEIVHNGKKYVGKEIIALAKTGAINDSDVDSDDKSKSTDILVDKFFTIKRNGVVLGDDLMFNDFDEAIKMFTKFTGSVVTL